MPAQRAVRKVKALRFKQWLSDWDQYDFSIEAQRRKPDPYIYMFSMRAAELRKLCDVYKRKRDGDFAEGIQRLRDPGRTGRIQRYVRYGYPFGDLKAPQRTAETLPLRKPGWLPTAIVINILVAGDSRRGNSVSPDHLVTIEDMGDSCFSLQLPTEEQLEGAPLAPFEVIDGQHRLWAFDNEHTDEVIPDDFELPVVAFYGLDVAWQAYLFWSINVSPKRINPSHAFDLYPLLRTQDWLERVGELTVYREARAQELTEILYAHPRSPWKSRINMLGERGSGGVSQAAWVRALLTTFLGTGRGQGRFGLFQSNLTIDNEPLEWTRAQQAAFLLYFWIELDKSFREAPRYAWLRGYGEDSHRALTDKTSMLNQDMGIRAVLAVANDLFFENAEQWRLDRWILHSASEEKAEDAEVDFAIEQLQTTSFVAKISELAQGLVRFDWRSLDGPNVKGDEELEVRKRSYRGSGGYSALRDEVLKTLVEVEGSIGRAAANLLRDSSVA